MAECFDCCCGKLCGFQNLEQSLKTTRFIRGLMWNFAVEECYIISAVSKIRLANVKRHVPDWSETSGSVSCIFEFGGNLFSSLCGVLDVKRYLCLAAD